MISSFNIGSLICVCFLDPFYYNTIYTIYYVCCMMSECYLLQSSKYHMNMRIVSERRESEMEAD